ncbi:hypothetical protein ACTRXD_18965 [Nitrospira sp. T9]|uniref:hypothetical protein n=1 Tax=unclassified Nitrospira TaxID=2652172 RepID=UPI003F95A16F
MSGQSDRTIASRSGIAEPDWCSGILIYPLTTYEKQLKGFRLLGMQGKFQLAQK